MTKSHINHDFSRTNSGVVSSIFSVLIVYFWGLQFLRGDGVYLVAEEISYYLFVFPTAAIALFGLIYILVTYSKLDNTSIAISIFGAIVLIASIARADLNTARTIGLLCVSLISIFRIRPAVSLTLVNALFLLALPITTVLFFLGYSQYTFIPGVGSHPFHWWRIGVYPSSAEGALFALVVLILNLNIRGRPFRAFFVVLSSYMLVLSGNRTALIAAMLVATFVILKQSNRLSSVMSQRVFVVGALALFFLFLFASDLLFYLPFADNAFVREVILRDEVLDARFDAGNELATAKIRTFIIEQHLGLFADNPLLGAGTFEFQQLTSGYGVLDNVSTGSEAFLTAFVARVGLPAFIFLFAIFLISRPMDEQARDLAICAKIALFIGMVTYGSFVNPYDIVFLLFVLCIAGCIKGPDNPRLVKG